MKLSKNADRMCGQPTIQDGRAMYQELASVPSMPHRGPRKERTQIIWEWLERAYQLGRSSPNCDTKGENDV